MPVDIGWLATETGIDAWITYSGFAASLTDDFRTSLRSTARPIPRTAREAGPGLRRCLSNSE